MTAPIFRSLDQLTGDLAPSPIGKILDTADEISGLAAELEALREERDELVIRNGELWKQVCDQCVELNALRAQLDRARAVEGWHGVTNGGLK
jgi:hypothetical protein